ARAIFEALTRDRPADSDYRAELATRVNYSGVFAYRTGRKQDAETAYRQSIELRQRQLRERPHDTRDLIGFIEAQTNLGLPCDQSARPDDAVSAYQAAIAIFRDLPSENPELRLHRFRFSALYHNLGSSNARRDRHAEAQSALSEAIRLRELWVRD